MKEVIKILLDTLAIIWVVSNVSCTTVLSIKIATNEYSSQWIFNLDCIPWKSLLLWVIHKFYFGFVHSARENRELDILIFKEVLENIARVDRTLTKPGGSLLMAGRSGVGRRTAVALVAHMHNVQLFTPKVSRAYGLKQFKTDLKSVRKIFACEMLSRSNFLKSLSMMNNEQTERKI